MSEKKLKELQARFERLETLDQMLSKLKQVHESGDKESSLEEVLEELKKYRNELDENPRE